MKKQHKESGPTFHERVIRIARSIPKGRVSTYGRIARAAGGGPLASRSITAILGKAYENGITDIPFHRIVYADGKVWISEKYLKERLQKYKEEHIELDKHGRVVDFADKVFDFN